MTHALLQQALNALEWHTQQTRPIHNTELAIDAIRAELAKPEPTQPAWQDAPTQPGDWVIVGKGFKSELQTGITQQEIDRVSSWPGRWFGPIPLPEAGK